MNILKLVAEEMWRQADLRSQLRDISNRVAHDFGALGSVREYGAEWNRANMLHQLDAGRYVHVIERRLIESLREALQAFGMSTEEFDERTKTIFGNSTKIENATFSNSTVAVGARARARTSGLTSGRGFDARG